MQHNKLGKWGLKVSRMGLGSYLTIGDRVSDRDARQIVRLAVDAGINFFDTADQYNAGQSEEALGDILSEYPRSSFVLATKVYNPTGNDPNERGLSRKHVFEACHASLRRLKMDYIDLYQCHRPDPDVPVEETAAAMNDLIRQGKVLYWGVSEWSAGQIAEACDVCRRMGFYLPVSDQPRYSLLWREPEREVFPKCQAEGMGVLAYSPLAHGVLTGKYKPGEPIPAGTRAASEATNKVMMGRYYTEENLERVQALGVIAKELGVTSAQLALAWIMARPAVSGVILGASRAEQLIDNLKAEKLQIPPDAMQRIETLFPHE